MFIKGIIQVRVNYGKTINVGRPGPDCVKICNVMVRDLTLENNISQNFKNTSVKIGIKRNTKYKNTEEKLCRKDRLKYLYNKI